MRKQVLLFIGVVFVSLVCGARAEALVLEGDYLKIGVHQSGALIDESGTVGIQYDRTGSGHFGVFDYLTPGDPFEFYSLGGFGKYVTAGYDAGNPFGFTTTDISVGSILAAKTAGMIGSDLLFTQYIGFASQSSEVCFQVILENLSERRTYRQLVYARGLDPDPDADLYGEYDTYNGLLGPHAVGAAGPISAMHIKMLSMAGRPSVSADWEVNPYELFFNPTMDGYGDNTINLAWWIGALKPGEMDKFCWKYRLGKCGGGQPVSEPATMALLGSGLLGLWFRKRRA